MEAGSAFNISQWNAFWEPGQSDVISVNDTGLGLRYGAQATYRGNPNYTNRYSQRFSTTYVTGTHTFKVGHAERRAHDRCAVHRERERELHVPERRSPEHHAVLNAVSPARSGQRVRHVCPGEMDDQPVDASTLACGSTTYYGWVPDQHTPGDTSPLAGRSGSQRVARRAELQLREGRAELEGPQPAHRRVVRPVRRWAHSVQISRSAATSPRPTSTSRRRTTRFRPR